MASAKRIAFIGTSGSGKTTLGREVARRIGAPFVEVDAIAHKAGWAPTSDAELRAGIDAVLARGDRWVIDGIFASRLGEHGSARADLVVWVDLPLPLKLARIVRRSCTRMARREILRNGNTETWGGPLGARDGLRVVAVHHHLRDRTRWRTFSFRHKLLRLRTRAEVERWRATFA
jgi:hypothetical protein